MVVTKQELEILCLWEPSYNYSKFQRVGILKLEQGSKWLGTSHTGENF